MWIIPSNLQLSSRSALEYLGSSEDLSELASTPVSWPTWKSKPTSLPTFMERYTASLEDIPVSHLVLSESKTATSMNSTSGRTSTTQPTLFDPCFASLKTLSTTSILVTKPSNPIWKDLVTRLRKEFTQRKKSAPLLRRRSAV